MTEPQSETPTQSPAPAPRTTRAVSTQETSSGNYVVKTPWTCNEFHVGDTVVTPQGVEVSAQEKDELVAAAKAVRMRLNVTEAGR